MDGSCWRVLPKRGPLKKGMANLFSLLALRTPWTVWKEQNDHDVIHVMIKFTKVNIAFAAHTLNHNIDTIVILLWIQVCVPVPHGGQTNQNAGIWRREVYCRAKQGEWVAHAQKTWILAGSWGKIPGERATAGCDWLVRGNRWCSRNLNHQSCTSIQFGFCSAWSYGPPPGWGP